MDVFSLVTELPLKLMTWRTGLETFHILLLQIEPQILSMTWPLPASPQHHVAHSPCSLHPGRLGVSLLGLQKPFPFHFLVCFSDSLFLSLSPPLATWLLNFYSTQSHFFMEALSDMLGRTRPSLACPQSIFST